MDITLRKHERSHFPVLSIGVFGVSVKTEAEFESGDIQIIYPDPKNLPENAICTNPHV
jgi:hypothetical protein